MKLFDLTPTWGRTPEVHWQTVRHNLLSSMLLLVILQQPWINIKKSFSNIDIYHDEINIAFIYHLNIK